MSFCRECGANLLEGGRFCTRCGTPAEEVVRPTSSAPPPVAPGRAATEPGAAGRGSVLPTRPPKAPPREFEDTPGLEDTPDLDAALAERYLKQPVPEGTVVCRFCKGPLDLTGTYCEQCGAPLEEAAPPGLIKPKPQPAAAPAVTGGFPKAPQAAAVQPPETSRRASEAFASTPRAAAGPDGAAERRRGAAHSDVGCV